MEKGTQKFLSVILSIAILFCFPIVLQAAENSYQETFTGTYTAPETARNVLVSGSDAKISEWYGDRVNIGGHTYSVRQNEYGLNKDGNMIKMDLNETYTIWLAQYGVASFAFTPDESGLYVFSSSETSRFSDSIQKLYEIQYSGIFRQKLTLVSAEYGSVKTSYGNNYYSAQSTEKNASFIYKLTKGETIYLAAGDDNNAADYCYDVSVSKYSQENCPHEYKYLSATYDGCTRIYNYKCVYCGNTTQNKYESHSWNWNYTYKATNCQETTTGTRTCDVCGKTESFSYENDGPHTPASKTVNYIGYWDIEYECVCGICGETYYDWEDSPCYDAENCSVNHSFGDRDSVPCGQEVTCTKCGYVYESSHDYDEERVVTPLSESGKCYNVTYTGICSKCGITVTEESYTHHRAWEYVQVTPQHDNVCGTYNYACADCGALRFDTPLTCHSYLNPTPCGFSCRRCGNVENDGAHTYDDGVYFAPTCTSDGGTIYTCVNCGATKIENAVPSTGHNFGDNSPTCLICGIANPNYIAPASPGTAAPTVQQTQATQETPVSTTPETTVKATAITSITGGEKKFKVSWKKSANADGYQLQYSTSKNFKKGNKTLTLKKVTSKTVSKLKKNSKYYVRVRAYKTVNGKKVYTSWSSAKSVITAAAPKKSSVSKTSAGKKKIKITWKKISGAKGYQVQYSTSKTFKSGKKTATVKNPKTTSTTLKNLKAKKTYYIRVRSYKVVKVNGKSTKVYSPWSKVKAVKTK